MYCSHYGGLLSDQRKTKAQVQFHPCFVDWHVIAALINDLAASSSAVHATPDSFAHKATFYYYCCHSYILLLCHSLTTDMNIIRKMLYYWRIWLSMRAKGKEEKCIGLMYQSI